PRSFRQVNKKLSNREVELRAEEGAEEGPEVWRVSMRNVIVWGTAGGEGARGEVTGGESWRDGREWTDTSPLARGKTSASPGPPSMSPISLRCHGPRAAAIRGWGERCEGRCSDCQRPSPPPSPFSSSLLLQHRQNVLTSQKTLAYLLLWWQEWDSSPQQDLCGKKPGLDSRLVSQAATGRAPWLKLNEELL
ncbi:hypothetical protein KUCAC02_016032, partial [Chaenocephalus aceratus]